MKFYNIYAGVNLGQEESDLFVASIDAAAMSYAEAINLAKEAALADYDACVKYKVGDLMNRGDIYAEYISEKNTTVHTPEDDAEIESLYNAEKLSRVIYWVETTYN